MVTKGTRCREDRDVGIGCRWVDEGQVDYRLKINTFVNSTKKNSSFHFKFWNKKLKIMITKCPPRSCDLSCRELLVLYSSVFHTKSAFARRQSPREWQGRSRLTWSGKTFTSINKYQQVKYQDKNINNELQISIKPS